MQWNSLSFELDACCYFQERFVLLWTWLDTWFFSFHKIIQYQIIVCWSLKPHFNLQMLKIEAMERFNTFNIWFNKLLWKMKVSSFYSSFWIYCVFTDYSHITVYNDNFKLLPKVYTNIKHGIRLSNGRLNLTVTLWQCNHYCILWYHSWSDFVQINACKCGGTNRRSANGIELDWLQSFSSSKLEHQTLCLIQNNISISSWTPEELIRNFFSIKSIAFYMI